MKISDAGLSLLKSFEGYVGHPYLDAAGIPTIGYGHVIRSGEDFSRGVTIAQAEDILRADVGDAEAAVNRNVMVDLNAHQFDALVCFAFNVGSGALASSTLLRLVNQQRWDECPPHFLEWCKVKSNGQLLENAGLKKRRAREAALFMTPMPVDPAVDVDQVMALVELTSRDILAAEIS